MKILKKRKMLLMQQHTEFLGHMKQEKNASLLNAKMPNPSWAAQ